MGAWHRGRRGARLARRDEREYREYLSEEQRRQAGCPDVRMPAAFVRWVLLLNRPPDRVEDGSRQFLRHPFANRAALDEDGAVGRFERHIPAIAGDALGPVLEA